MPKKLIPQPWNARVSSIEAGIGTPGASAALTYTWTSQQIADFLTKYGLVGLDLLSRPRMMGPLGPVTPAMGPHDELPAFARTLQSGVGTVGTATAPPVRYLSSREANPLGSGMGDWRSTAQNNPPSQPSPREPGGLLGLIQDYLRNN